MVRAIREIVTVGPNGTIRVQDPELRQGAKAEVIVLLDTGLGGARLDPLIALEALQKSVGLKLSEAQAWAHRSDDERKASSRL